MKVNLPSAFEVEVPDDSMEPLLMKGNIARFSTTAKIAPGKRVLVSDQDGHAYIRVYRQKRVDHWQADALNPAYEPMDSIKDGLRVMAVLIGVDWE